jgi:hypothetical protein
MADGARNTLSVRNEQHHHEDNEYRTTLKSLISLGPVGFTQEAAQA